jgi:hypothetical protein
MVSISSMFMSIAHQDLACENRVLGLPASLQQALGHQQWLSTEAGGKSRRHGAKFQKQTTSRPKAYSRVGLFLFLLAVNTSPVAGQSVFKARRRAPAKHHFNLFCGFAALPSAGADQIAGTGHFRKPIAAYPLISEALL